MVDQKSFVLSLYPLFNQPYQPHFLLQNALLKVVPPEFHCLSYILRRAVVVVLPAQLIQLEDSKHSEVFIAVYENKLLSNVNAGENNGRELKHDYVVRDLLGA